MKTRVVIATLAAALAAALPARAQSDDNDGSSIYVEVDDAKPLLEQAKAAEGKGRWDVAVEKYAKVLKEHPDNMAMIGTDGKTWGSVRRYVFLRIAKFPPQGLAAYSAANDAVAKSLYEQALKDGTGLERIVNEYFFTAVGDDAAARLADACAEQGRLQDATYYWELATKVYPNSDLPMATLYAKWGAACRKSGDEAGWAIARQGLVDLGDAPLMIAGTKISAREAVAVLEKITPAKLRLEKGSDWPRPGGNNSATRVTDGVSKNEVRLWSWPRLTDEQVQQRTAQRNQVWRGMTVQGVSFLQMYPAVGPGGIVVVADGNSCWALSLDGSDEKRELWKYPLESTSDAMFTPALQDQPRVMSLVAPVIDHGVVYVNFLPKSVNRGVQNEGTYLAAIPLGSRTLEGSGVPIWTTEKNPDLEKLWFGSPPVVYGERVYAAVASAETQATPEVELVILDARDGRLVKRVFLCQGKRGQNNWAGMTISEAPTIAESGGVLYINTNLGGLAAVQAATGEVLWLTEYLEADSKPNPNRQPRQLTDRNGRGLSPIVVLGNRVCFIAGDSDLYMEYNARTGKRILAVPARGEKENPNTNTTVRWFCGIVDSKAWFQTSLFPFVIDLSDINFHHWYRRLPGKELGPDPAMAKLLRLTLGANPKVPGKGFLTADQFYLAHEMALSTYDLHSLKLTNILTWQENTKRTDVGTAVVVGKHLLTLSDAGITCFTDQGTFDKGYEAVLASATPDLAKLEEHAGVLARNPATWEGAIADYKRIAALAATSNPPLALRARTRTMELYRALGDADMKAGTAKSYADAINHYRQAVEAAPAEVALGDVFQVMGDCYERLNQWKEAVAVYQEVIEKYGERMLTTENGLVEPVRRFAQEKIQRLVKEHGAELYGEVEKKAKEALEKLKEKASPEELRKWLENFPNSGLGASASGLLADRLEAAGKTSEAGLVLLEAAASPGAGASAAPFLARAGKLFASAQAWERLEGAAGRLERVHGGETVSVDGKEMNAIAAASALRALRPPQPTPGATDDPKPWREWRVDAVDVNRIAADKQFVARDAGPTLLAPTGAWAGLDPKSVFFVQRGAILEARDAESDKALWTSVDPRGYFGVVITDGVSFADVIADQPAAKAGIQRGDALVEWNGRPVRSEDQLRRLICGAGGETVDVVVRRGEERLPIKVTVGKRTANSPPAEPADSLVFTDGGLLLIVRGSSVQAVHPSTGETAWVHCPVYPKTARVTRAVAADGRLFLAWAPGRDSSVNPTNPAQAEKDVSIEALDAADGRVLWQYRESNCDVLDLIAAAGTGTVVKVERRGVGGRLRILDAAHGTERRQDITAVLLPGATRLAAGLDAGRLVYLSEANWLGSYDLFSGTETRRDLKGQKAVPDAFVPANGHAVLAYSATRRVLFVGPEPAANCLSATLPDGVPDPDGLGIAGDLVVVMTRAAGNGGDTKGMLRWFSTTGGELKVKWQTELGTQGTAMGLVRCGSDMISIWVGPWRTDRRVQVLPIVQGFSPAKLRAMWEIVLAEDAAAGPLVGAGQQGGTIWVQYDDKLVLYR